ncbi:hypothetical protein, partial [Cryobacterium luteum]|uniref:hypothetical protein n=1 Tax=Cryobacterium luteum TaxID=1424661 RepID=UPI001A7E0FE8
ACSTATMAGFELGLPGFSMNMGASASFTTILPQIEQKSETNSHKLGEWNNAAQRSEPTTSAASAV